MHQARNWWWFQTSHGADATGPLAGRPYDGHLTLADGRGQWWDGYDPQQLYGPKHPSDALPDVSYVKNFYDRTRDLLDQHNPDLLYFDDRLFPLGWGGMNIGAYYYNQSLQTNGGKMEGVINIKMVPPNLAKAVVADIERGLAGTILPYPWQSETCIGTGITSAPCSTTGRIRGLHGTRAWSFIGWPIRSARTARSCSISPASPTARLTQGAPDSRTHRGLVQDQ